MLRRWTQLHVEELAPTPGVYSPTFNTNSASVPKPTLNLFRISKSTFHQLLLKSFSSEQQASAQWRPGKKTLQAGWVAARSCVSNPYSNCYAHLPPPSRSPTASSLLHCHHSVPPHLSSLLPSCTLAQADCLTSDLSPCSSPSQHQQSHSVS